MTNYKIICFPENHWPDRCFPERHWLRRKSFVRSDELLHSPCAILGAYVVEQNKMNLPSSAAAWPLYKTHIPDGNDVPDRAGCIYDVFSQEHSRINTQVQGRHYGLQISFRDVTLESAMDKAREVFNLLEGVHNVTVTVNGTDYELQAISPMQGPTCIGIDPETRRYYCVFNFLAVIKYMEAA